MCSASGRATPGLLSQLAVSRREMLPSSMHRPWAESNRYKISELMSFTAERPLPVSSPSLPFCVRFNEPLRRRRQHYGFTLLIDSLQHSIRSLWLRATPAGITPACHQTISSPHVHCFVSRIPRLHADCQEQLPTRQLFPLALALSGAISNSNSELLAAELGELHAWRALDGKS